MEIEFQCNECHCEGFFLDKLDIDFTGEIIWLLGHCPNCKRFVRISLNNLIKEFQEDA